MLKIRGLTKSYGSIVAAAAVDLTVAPGRMVGFVGPNGAGKSTTMRSVMGLVEPDAGSITWSGKPVDARTLERIGYLPEQRGLYPKMGIAEQVIYFARLKGVERRTAEDRASQLLGELGLGDRLDDKLHKLSHGNQQRVQVAVALACDPELLILDEPFSGLDPVAAQTLQDVLEQRVSAGTAVLFSSHQLDLVERVCDEVAVIIEGRIEAAGDIEQVKGERGHRRGFIRVNDPSMPLIDVLAGLDVTSYTETTASVALTSEGQIDDLLARARRAGPVLELRYELPPLTELFSDLVSASTAPNDRTAR